MPIALRTGLLAGCLLLCLSTRILAGPIVLFDEGHGQRFLAGQTGPLDLSKLAAEFKTAGYTLETSPAELSAKLLAQIDVLVISGAFLPLKATELDAVEAFLTRGGSLAVMLHIAPPLRDLLDRLEVDYTNAPVQETQHVIADNPLDFRVIDLETHPLTRGLDGFFVYGSWALRGMTEQVRSLARTSPGGWVDLDRNGQLSKADAVQPFAVLVAGEPGRGKFVVFGDDALFQNRFLLGGNRLLAANLAAWLAPQRP